MGSYKAIIFDLGKVILDYSFRRTFKFWASVLNKQTDDIRNTFIFDDTFEEFERGKITAEQFRSKTLDCLRSKMTNEDFDKGWCESFIDSYDGSAELLAALSEKYRIVALTNTNIIHEEFCKEKFSNIFKNFEKIFYSHQIKTRKPEVKSYEIVIDYLQLKPSEIIFVDDNINNINIAASLGIKSLLVKSPQQMQIELKGILRE